MIACFDIGGSFIKYGVADADGLVPELGRVKVPANDYDAFVAALKAAIAEMPGPVEIVSIAIAGFVDPETGRAIIANIPCINGRVLQPDLDKRLGCRTIVTNDADCFALAESGHGVAQGKANVFAIILGSGVGGGLVINGRLVNGAGGIAGEWGHSPIVDPLAGGLLGQPLPEIACGCGRSGCLDSYGGARGLERIHLALANEILDSTEILSAWRAGNSAASRSVDVYVETIARALNLIVNTVGIDAVPVGGGLASAPDLIARLDERVRALALAPRRTPLVVPGMRAADGGLVGAALAGAQMLGGGGMGDFGVKRAVLELCIDAPAGLAAAASGGADRVELTSALSVGGVTPSPGFMRMARDSGIPTMAMIRPRGGSFIYSEDEIALMISDIAEARTHGLTGVVFGVANPDGTLDVEVMKRLKQAAGPLETCLHRVFDLVPDPFAAIDQAVDLGFTRILTAGQQTSVPDGLDLLVRLQAHAGSRISIMPGGGITLQNVGQVIRSTGITEIHASCSRRIGPAESELVRFGFAPAGPLKAVDPEAVAEMRRMLAVIAAPDPVLDIEGPAPGSNGVIRMK